MLAAGNSASGRHVTAVHDNYCRPDDEQASRIRGCSPFTRMKARYKRRTADVWGTFGGCRSVSINRHNWEESPPANTRREPPRNADAGYCQQTAWGTVAKSLTPRRRLHYTNAPSWRRTVDTLISFLAATPVFSRIMPARCFTHSVPGDA